MVKQFFFIPIKITIFTVTKNTQIMYNDLTPVQEEAVEKLEANGFKIDMYGEYGVHMSKRKRGSGFLVTVEDDGMCNGMSSVEDAISEAKEFLR